MTRQTLVIHIGQPRAGSSAIQGMLRDNSARLRSHGIAYLNHHADRLPIRRRMHAVDDGCRGAARRLQELVRALTGRISALAAQKIVISAEGLWLRHEPSIRILHSLSKHHVIEIHAVLRAPEDWIASWYRLRVARGYTGSSTALHAEAQSLGHLDYDAMLAPWREHFGARNVHAMAFPDNGGNPAFDFARQLGLSHAAAGALRYSSRHQNRLPEPPRQDQAHPPTP